MGELFDDLVGMAEAERSAAVPAAPGAESSALSGQKLVDRFVTEMGLEDDMFDLVDFAQHVNRHVKPELLVIKGIRRVSFQPQGEPFSERRFNPPMEERAFYVNGYTLHDRANKWFPVFAGVVQRPEFSDYAVKVIHDEGITNEALAGGGYVLPVDVDLSHAEMARRLLRERLMFVGRFRAGLWPPRS